MTKVMLSFLLSFSVLTAAADTGLGPQPGLEPRPPVRKVQPPSFAPDPGDSADFIIGPMALPALKGLARTIRTGLGALPIVKIVYEVKGPQSGIVHFVDTKKYEYHYYFITGELGYHGSNDEFNKRNYGGPLSSREFANGSLVLFPGEDGNTSQLLYELWSGDTLDPIGLRTLLNSIQSQLPTDLKFKFHPLSQDQEKVAALALKRADYVLTSELMGERSYLSLNEGDAVGYVTFSSGEQADYDLRHIVVFDRVPNEFGLAAGVITGEAQTPLSHVNVKSINRRTLNMYLKDALKVLKKYEGRAVELKARAQGYEIRVLDPKVDGDIDQLIAKFWRERQPGLKEKPTAIHDPAYENSLVDLANFYQKLPTRKAHQRLIQTVGAKAANLALLSLITKQYREKEKSSNVLAEVRSPSAYGVHFTFFDRFMNQKYANLDITMREYVVRLLNEGRLLDPSVLHPIEVSAPILERVRKAISVMAVPKELLELFRVLIMEDKSSPIHISKIPRLRLRSSTNSEDLDGFTGAGLYDSDGVNFYKKDPSGGYDLKQPKKWKKIEEDLRELIPRLYSGIFNDRAFQEREWFGLNGQIHMDIEAGLAVHEAFPQKGFQGADLEVANFVAVTTNLSNSSEYYKISINAQHFDLSITNPPTAEELLEYGEKPGQAYSADEYVVTTFLADDISSSKPDSWKKWPVEKQRATSVRNGKSVLREIGEDGSVHDEVRELSKFLRFLGKQAAAVYGKNPDQFPIDVEGKILGDGRTILIKQFRPFTPPEK